MEGRVGRGFCFYFRIDAFGAVDDFFAVDGQRRDGCFGVVVECELELRVAESQGLGPGRRGNE